MIHVPALAFCDLFMVVIGHVYFFFVLVANRDLIVVYRDDLIRVRLKIT